MDVAEAIPQQERFARHIKDGKACHTLFHTLNEFERVSDSPTQGKELKANPDILAFLRNEAPDSHSVPLSFQDSAALQQSMRSILETHSFLTWSVMAFIRYLHDRNLLPKDDQIISQLKKKIFLQGLWQLGFWPIVICRLRHLEEEAAPSLSYGAFSLRCTDVDPYFGSLYFA